MAENEAQEDEQASSMKMLRKLLKDFCESDDAKETQQLFKDVFERPEVQGEDMEALMPYQKLKTLKEMTRVKGLCETLDNKLNKIEYKKEARNRCKGKNVLVVGGGPCGLRSAVEMALLGMNTVVVEQRDVFTRNSVLSLWLFLVDDLKSIGFKDLLPRFGLGDRLHASIRRLQLVLLKIALLLGVEVNLGVEFEGIIEPPKKKAGWKARFKTLNESQTALKDFQFEVLLIANGRQNFEELGFNWVRIERMLAIAIAANFKNRNKKEDLEIVDMGGKGVMHQLDFFNELKDAKGTDLENVFYLKDDTHYFVMTGKRENLVERGVLKEDTGKKTILDRSNIDKDQLMIFAKDVAAFCTEDKLPLEFYEVANKGADVGIFEFTSRSHAKQAAIIKEKKGQKLLIGLVGDSLKQPFWPEGVGIAHGFFGVFDTAWMVYEWLGENLDDGEIMINRRETYSSLKELTKDNMKAIREYTTDPLKRYAKYRDFKTPKAPKDPNEKPEVVNRRPIVNPKKVEGTKSEEKQKGVSDQSGGGKKKKEKKTETGPDETKTTIMSWFRGLFGGNNKDKKEMKEKKGAVEKSSSANNINDKTDGEETLVKISRLSSFRKSIRRATSFRRKKTKDTKVQEDKDAKVDEGNNVKQDKTEKTEENDDTNETSKKDIAVKVEVH